MKKYVMVLVMAAAVSALLGFVGNASAADANQHKETPKEKQVTLKGVVSEVKDKDGNVTEVQLTVGKEVYMITIDSKGKELGKMAGKTAKVTGTLEVKDNVKWLTVKTYGEAPAKSETKPKSTKTK